MNNNTFPKKYVVVAETSYFCSTDDPMEALRLWFMAQERFPENVAIRCRRREDAFELVENVSDELLESYTKEFRVPYKLDFLKDSVRNQRECKCKYFLDGIGDQIEPFSFG